MLKRRIKDLIFRGLIYLSAAFSVFLLIGIIVYVFVKGISLKLRLMSKEKLVICGKIHAVQLQEETQ